MNRRLRLSFTLAIMIAFVLSLVGVLQPQRAVLAGAGDPDSTNTTIGFNNSTIINDNSSSTTLTVTVKDSLGNAVSGASLTVELSINGGSFGSSIPSGLNASASLSGSTDGSGIYSITFTSNAAVASVSSFNAQALVTASTNFTKAASSGVTINQAPAVAGNSSVSVNPTAIDADGTTTALVTVVMNDGGNKPVVGRTITMSTNPSLSGVTFSNNSSGSNITDGTGTATFRVSSTAAGSTNIVATNATDSVSVQTAITFNTAPPSTTNSTVSSSPSAVPADNTTTSTIVVTIKDAGGNPIQGASAALSPDLGSGVTISGPFTGASGNSSGPSDANGNVNFKVKSSTPSVTVTFTGIAIVNSTQYAILNKATVQFDLPQVSEANSDVSPSVTNNVPDDNTTITTITITPRDLGNNVLKNRTFSYIASAAITAVNCPTTTGASGIVTCTFKRNSTQGVGTVTLTFSVGGVALSTKTASIDFVAALPDKTTTIVTRAPSSGNITGDGASAVTITATVLDKGSQPVQGVSMTLALTSAANAGVTITPSTAQLTNALGQVSWTVKAVIPSGSYAAQFTATDGTNGITFDGDVVNVNFIVPNTNASTSTVVASPTAVNATGVSPDCSTITVTTKDANGNLLNGKSVTLTANPSTNVTISSTCGGASNASATTSGSGTATFSVRSSNETTVVFTATTSEPVTITQTASVNFSTALAVEANSSVNAVPGSVAADNTTTSTITITLRNAGNNPSVGKVLSLSTSASGVTISPPTAATNSSGIATFTVKSSIAGSATFTINNQTDSIADFIPTTGSKMVTFTGATSGVDLNKSTIDVTPATVANNAVATVTVILRNSANVPISGIANPGGSAISGLPGGTTVTPVIGPSGNDGKLTWTVLGGPTAGGPYTLTATVDDSGNSRTITAPTVANGNKLTFSGGAPAPVSAANSRVDVSPASVAGGATGTITVTLRDASNNPIVGLPVANAALNGLPGTVSPVSTTSVSDSQGRLIWTLTGPATATTATVTATVSSVNVTTPSSANSNQFTFTGTPAQTFSAGNSRIDVSPSSVASGATGTITLTIKDTTGAIIQGVAAASVTLNGLPSGVTATATTTPSNSSGQLVWTITGPATASTATITATYLSSTVSTPSSSNGNVFNFTGAAATNVSSTNSRVDVSPSSVAFGSTGTITVTLKDSTNTSIVGLAVSNATLSGLPSGVTAVSTTSVSNSSGQLIWTIVGPSTASSATVTATVSAVNITTPSSTNGNVFTFPGVNVGSVNAANSRIDVSPTTLGANQSAIITVTLRDPSNIPVIGIPIGTVTINNLPSGITATAQVAVSDSAGKLTWSITSGSSTTGTYVLTASIGVIVINTPTTASPASNQITFGSSGTTSATNSTVYCNFTQIPADNTTTASMTIVLKDSTGAVVPNKSVLITVTPNSIAGISVTAANGSTITDSNGSVVFNIRSSGQGTAVFSATDSTSSPNVILLSTCTIVFAAPGTTPIAAATPIGGLGTTTITPTGTVLAPGTVIGKVIAGNLRVRTGPGLTFPIIGLLKYKTEVTVVGRNSRGTWYLIQLSTGTAWVSANFISIKKSEFKTLPVVDSVEGTAPLLSVPQPLIPEFGQGIGIVNTYRLRVRTGPGKTYQQIGLLKQGMEVLILGKSPDSRWYEIKILQGNTETVGWISVFYTKIKSIDGVKLNIIQPPPRQ